MAIDLFSDSSSRTTSPRISFSYDLHNPNDQIASIHETHPHQSDPSIILDSKSEFNFCVGISIKTEASSADELFSDGLIRPQQIQQNFVKSSSTRKQVSLSNPKPIPSHPLLSIPASVHSDYEAKNPQPKSFWGIKRSSSLHFDNSHKKSPFWSLSRLSRSNSTGSVPNHTYKQNPNKQEKLFASSSSSSHKPPLRKNYGGAYGNVVRVSPIMNVPPPYIYRGTTNLSGLGSLFCSGKAKKNIK